MMCFFLYLFFIKTISRLLLIQLDVISGDVAERRRVCQKMHRERELQHSHFHHLLFFFIFQVEEGLIDGWMARKRDSNHHLCCTGEGLEEESVGKVKR